MKLSWGNLLVLAGWKCLSGQFDLVLVDAVFSSLHSCFLSLLLVAAVVWKIKQSCWASRRREVRHTPAAATEPPATSEGNIISHASCVHSFLGATSRCRSHTHVNFTQRWSKRNTESEKYYQSVISSGLHSLTSRFVYFSAFYALFHVQPFSWQRGRGFYLRPAWSLSLFCFLIFLKPVHRIEFTFRRTVIECDAADAVGVRWMIQYWTLSKKTILFFFCRRHIQIEKNTMKSTHRQF